MTIDESEVILEDHLTSCSLSSVVNHPTPAHSYSPMFAVSFSPLTVVHRHLEPKQHSILAQNLSQYLFHFMLPRNKSWKGYFGICNCCSYNLMTVLSYSFTGDNSVGGGYNCFVYLLLNSGKRVEC